MSPACWRPRLSTSVLDPAHAAEQTSPTPERNFLIAGLVGLAAGIAAALAVRRPARAPAVIAEVDPEVERRLRARIDDVAKRERALARRAGELAARERAVEQRAAEPPPHPLQEVATPKPQVPEEQPVVAPGEWNLLTLERLVHARTEADPARQQAWNTYLFVLRDTQRRTGACLHRSRRC